MKTLKQTVAIFVTAMMVLAAASIALAQGQGKGNTKKDEKKLNKDARKLGETAEEAAQGLGRDAVFCILAAHTSIADFESAQQLKAKFESLTDFPFGQFVAAVLLVDRLDKEGFGLNDVIAKLQAGESIGQITKEANVNMGEVRSGMGQMRSELARSMTNPPTKNCFETTP
ncbi:MAG TPA: hypothetical protein VNN73_10275 [Blastocatellia bacterium]|jgi:hypothetical protein|nr:hypothetical protein [Blastocatellia bacterium]